MAGSAKDQRLSFSCGHDPDPAWLLPTVICLQIFECPDVMHFYLIGETGGLTHFTYLCQKSLFQFRSTAPYVPGTLVQNDGLGNSQANTSIDASLIKAPLRVSSFHSASFRVVLEDGHFIAQEFGSAASRVCDQCLLF